MNKALAFAGILFAAISASNCTAKADRRIQLRYMAWGNVEQLALEQELVDRFNRKTPTSTSASSKSHSRPMATRAS